MSSLEEVSIEWVKFLQDNINPLNRVDKELAVQMIGKSLGLKYE